MPRPVRTENSRPRRDDILDHATHLFAERGYEGTSMGDLAERVGMRKASLFYHFESKDVLYAAVLEKLVASVAAHIATAATADGSFPERLDALSDAITDVLGRQPYAARIIIREAMDWGPVMQKDLAGKVLSVLGVADEFVRAGQHAGVFVKGDAKQLIVTLVGIHFMPFGIGAIVERYTGKDPFDEGFIDARKAAVREQVRNLILAR